MFINFINEIICDQVKAAYFSVATFISGLLFKSTGALMDVTGYLIQPTLEHSVTVILTWLSFILSITVAILSIVSKCRNWNNRKKWAKQAEERHRHPHFED